MTGLCLKRFPSRKHPCQKLRCVCWRWAHLDTAPKRRRIAAGAPASGTAFVAALRERRRAGGRRSEGSVKMRPSALLFALASGKTKRFPVAGKHHAMKKLRIGLIGYGFMGRAHSNAYRKVGNFFDLEHECILQAAWRMHSCSRSKKLPTLRYALECARPMKPQPMSPMRDFFIV